MSEEVKEEGGVRPPGAPPAHHEPTEEHGFWVGRSGLVMCGILVAIGIFVIMGIYDMDVPPDADTLFGPKAFPWIAAVACFIVAAFLALDIVRHPDVPESMLDENGHLLPGTASNWTSTAITTGSFILFAVLLVPVGWIISAAIAFWGITVGLGSKKYVFNLMIGIAVSSIMQLVFGGLLGLNLPPGIFG